MGLEDVVVRARAEDLPEESRRLHLVVLILPEALDREHDAVHLAGAQAHARGLEHRRVRDEVLRFEIGRFVAGVLVLDFAGTHVDLGLGRGVELLERHRASDVLGIGGKRRGVGGAVRRLLSHDGRLEDVHGVGRLLIEDFTWRRSGVGR